MFTQFNKQMLWGALLILLGVLFLLQTTGILGALGDLFWTLAFTAAGGVFFVHFSNRSAGALVGGDPWLHVAGSGRHDLLRAVCAADVGRGQRRPLFGFDRPWLSGGLHH